MKRIFNLVIGLIIVLISCNSCKMEKVFPENTLLAITPTSDPTYCSLDSVFGTDCGIGDIYLTKEGDVLYSPDCNGDEIFTYHIGKYNISDTGIVCTFNSEYSYSLGCQDCAEEDVKPIDPNSGKIIDSKKWILVLKKTNCKDFPYFIVNANVEDRQALRIEADKNDYCQTISGIKALSKFHCSNQTNTVIVDENKDKNDELLKIYSDSTAFIADKVLKNVEIDNVQFTIMTFRDKLNDNREKFNLIDESPLTVIMINNNNNKVIYVKKFDFDQLYMSYLFHKWDNQPLNKYGKLYFEVFTNSGGSGSINKMYFFNYKEGAIHLNEIFESNELSFAVFNSDNNILLLEGIWDKDEGHFDKHRFEISSYICRDYYFSKNIVGKTKLKYDFNQQPIQQTLSKMKLKEPLLMNHISQNGRYFH